MIHGLRREGGRHMRRWSGASQEPLTPWHCELIRNIRSGLCVSFEFSAGYLQIIWSEMSGSACDQFSAKLGHRTPLSRSGSLQCTVHQKQPGRSVLSHCVTTTNPGHLCFQEPSEINSYNMKLKRVGAELCRPVGPLIVGLLLLFQVPASRCFPCGCRL